MPDFLVVSTRSISRVRCQYAATLQSLYGVLVKYLLLLLNLAQKAYLLIPGSVSQIMPITASRTAHGLHYNIDQLKCSLQF